MVDNTLQPLVTIQPKVEVLPPWVSAAKSAMADNVRSRGKLSTHISSQEEQVPFEERVGLKKSVFTCEDCPQRYCELFEDENEVKILSFYVYNVKRCSPCNIKYKRWQRVRRAFKWLAQECQDRNVRPKFLTITEPLRTSPVPFTEEQIKTDRMRMCKEFRMTRKSSAWPRNYQGIWVYEAKVRAPGDEIRARWPDEDGNHPVLRVATEFELHGHIHCALATKWLEREPLLERHSGVHVKASGIKHMKKYLMGYMLVDTVGRYNRIGSTYYG
jgi:hypothetical protein